MKPDLNAPRYRRKRINLCNKEFYEIVRKKIPESRLLSDIQIKKIILTYNKNTIQTVIDERDGIEFPESVGNLFIGSCKIKDGKNRDYKMSAEYMKVVSHNNFKTDGNTAKIFFTTFATRYKFKNHELWGFNPSRIFTRQVSREYPKNWSKYYDINNLKKISTIYKDDKRKKFAENNLAEELKAYNEFEL